MTSRIALVAAFMLFVQNTTIAFSTPKWAEVSESIAESKKHGVFIRELSVRPMKFSWEGHQVEVKEAWLERDSYEKDKCKDDYLAVKFFIDANPDAEARIAVEDRKYIKLSRDDVDAKNQPKFVWHKSPIKKIFGGRERGVTHFVTIPKDSPPSSIVLRVGTREYDGEAPVRSRERVSETVLTFELQPKPM